MKFNKDKNNHKNIIEIGDFLKIQYRIAITDELGEKKLDKIDEIHELIVGENNLWDGFDKMLINKKIENGYLEIDNFKMPPNAKYYPNEIVSVGIKVLEHKKSIKDNLIEKEIEDIKQENKNLRIKIENLENQRQIENENFKLKINEMSTKAQNEVIKLKNELKEHAKNEVEESKKFQLQKICEDLLNPLNNLYISVEFGSNSDDPQISGYVKGFQLLINQIFDILKKYGVETIEPKIGDVFDPAYHHINEMIDDSNFKKEQIVKVFSRGYMLNGRVIKPAIVAVAN